MELPDGPSRRLTFDGGAFPAWTGDGQFILYVRDDGVYRVRTDASSPAEHVLRADGIGWIQPAPDDRIAFEVHNGDDLDVGVASLTGEDTVRLLVTGPANEEDPAVSPDGRRLAYESDESGRRQVYVMPFGQPGRGRQISVAGGNNPLWSSTGEELFFTNDDNVFESVRVRSDPGFEIVRRDTLFSRGRLTGRFPGPGASGRDGLSLLVGYGTLLNRASLGQTIGADVATSKLMRPVIVNGFRRLYNLRPDHGEIPDQVDRSRQHPEGVGPPRDPPRRQCLTSAWARNHSRD
jgi:hypothetical protein